MGPRVKLVLQSALMLFVELVLIRWCGAKVVYLSFFSNFVLLGSFLGIGIGFLRGTTGRDFSGYAPVGLAFLIAFVVIFPVQVDRSGGQLVYFGALRASGLPAWMVLPVIFLAVAGVMEMIAEGVARTFALFPPLTAYRLDITGSLLGIAGFSGVSFLGAPPLAWAVIIAALFLATWARRTTLLMGVALAGIIVMFLHDSTQREVVWSPYYEIAVRPTTAGSYAVDVNGIPHQAIEPSSVRRAEEPVYFEPYAVGPASPKNVLIIGAGTGSDVAIALAQGAQHVDAVEIDPALARLGLELHPDHPYQDPRVTIHVTDGRAFLQQTETRYDLILFALPDSLTLVQGQSAVRLESFLFTTQAIAAARDHLAPGGMFAMYNYYREPWLVDRLAGTLDTVFGTPPCIAGSTPTAAGGLSLLADGSPIGGMRCPHLWTASAAGVPAPATDDHPFVYLLTRSIPGRYLVALALILLVSLAAVRLTGGPLARMRGYADLFFMGAAFLLLETKSVVQFALLFGTTWFVNALVFGGVLASVLLAIWVASRFAPKRMWALYGSLFAALAVAWAVPPAWFLGLAFWPRLVAATAISFSPIFIANLVFAERFRGVGNSTRAFGANLLGAMFGGVLEYLSLITGYRALLVVCGLLYALAFLLRARARRGVDVGERSTVLPKEVSLSGTAAPR